MARARRWMRAFLAYAMPAYLVLVATLAVQGAADPWPPARDALARHAGDTPVMVGIATRADRDPGRGLRMSTSRYYVLVPGVLRDPRLLRITQVDGGPVRESASRAGLLALLAALVACLAGTWWLWIGPGREREGDEPR